MKKYLHIILFLFTSCAGTALNPAKGKILVIVSSESELPLKDGKKYRTGYFFNELIIPVMRLKEKGYEVVFANPIGNTPYMDIRSLTAKYFKNEEEYTAAKILHENLETLRAPRSLRAIVDDGLSTYNGLFIPGGHAPMTDLMIHPEMGTILEHFHKNKKPTALICHGPVVLAAAMDNPEKFKNALIENDSNGIRKYSKKWPYRGYRMTIFSTIEEKASEEALDGVPLFYPEEVLKRAGGKVSVGNKWEPNVLKDKELITGQNPASDELLVQTFIKALED